MSDYEPAHAAQTRAAAVLLEKLKEFRQSYNRTHGQVCEFFEQAHIIEKVYQQSPGPSKTVARREEETEGGENDDDCCNEQKTSSIKHKLNCWRAVMREVVADVCPNLQLENQPDVNPGLMKHVLDEIRRLKTELAFQHNAILELKHELESRQNKNQKKDRLIEKLMRQRSEMPLETGQGGTTSAAGMHFLGSGGSRTHHLHTFTSFDQEEALRFGSIDHLSELSLDLQDLQPLWVENDNGGSTTIREGTSIHQVTLMPTHYDFRSHALPNEGTHGDGSNEDSVDGTIHNPSSSDVPSNLVRMPLRERWTSPRAVMGLCGRLCFFAVLCKAIHRKSGK